MTTTTTLSLLPFLLLLSSVKVSYSINIAEVNCNQSTATTSSDNNYNNVITDCLPLGEAFNILHGYGFLSFSIHVAPLAPFPTNHHQSKHSSSNDSSAVDRTNERSSAVAVKQHMHLFHLTTHPVLDRRYFERDVRRYSRLLLKIYNRVCHLWLIYYLFIFLLKGSDWASNSDSANAMRQRWRFDCAFLTRHQSRRIE